MAWRSALDIDSSSANARIQRLGPDRSHSAWTNRTSDFWKESLERESDPYLSRIARPAAARERGSTAKKYSTSTSTRPMLPTRKPVQYSQVYHPRAKTGARSSMSSASSSVSGASAGSLSSASSDGAGTLNGGEDSSDDDVSLPAGRKAAWDDDDDSVSGSSLVSARAGAAAESSRASSPSGSSLAASHSSGSSGSGASSSALGSDLSDLSDVSSGGYGETRTRPAWEDYSKRFPPKRLPVQHQHAASKRVGARGEFATDGSAPARPPTWAAPMRTPLFAGTATRPAPAASTATREAFLRDAHGYLPYGARHNASSVGGLLLSPEGRLRSAVPPSTASLRYTTEYSDKYSRPASGRSGAYGSQRPASAGGYSTRGALYGRDLRDPPGYRPQPYF